MPLSLNKKHYQRIGVLTCLGIAIIGGFLYWRHYTHTHLSTTLHFGLDDSVSKHSDVFLASDSIESGSVSTPQITNTTYHRTLSGGRAKIDFTPPFNIRDLATLGMSFQIQHPAGDITLESNTGDTLPLYIGGMEHMHKQTVHSSVTNADFFVYTDSAVQAPDTDEVFEDWLKKNASVPTDITNDITGFIQWDKLQSLPAADTTATTLDATFYNDATFTIFADKQLTLSFSQINSTTTKKIDTTVSADIQDRYGKIVANTTFTNDQLMSKKTISANQHIQWDTKLPADGVYRLHLHTMNSKAKMAFQHLTINTPFIALNSGTILTDFPIQTQLLNTAVPINFALGQDSQKTDITFSGDHPFTYTTSGNTLLTEHAYAPEVGTYTFDYDRTITLMDGFFSIAGATPFTPYTIAQTTIEPKIIITGANLTTTANSDTLTVSNHWGTDEIQAMAAKALENNAPMTLIESDPLQPTLHDELLNNYQQIWSGCDTLLLSVFSYPADAFATKPCDNPGSLPSIAASIIPEHSQVASLVPEMDTANLYNTIDADSVEHAPTVTIPLSLRGDHEFMLATPDDLHLAITTVNINKAPGADDYTIIVSDAAGSILASSDVADDKNVSDDGIASEQVTTTITPPRTQSGLYRVQIASKDSEQQDFVITQMQMNTSEFMAVGHVWSYLPTTFYTHLGTLVPINFFAVSTANNNDADDILVDSDSANKQRITFNSENDHVNRALLFPAGDHEFQTGKAQMQLSGANFAFSPNGLFDYGPYSLGTDYLLVQDEHWGSTAIYSATFNYSY